MIHQIARTDTDGGTGWLPVPTHVLFDWVLRAGPAAALESAGLADQATQVQNLPSVTKSMVARPRRLKPHARLLCCPTARTTTSQAWQLPSRPLVSSPRLRAAVRPARRKGSK